MIRKSVIDQMGRVVEFNFPPKRIVSLVPSQTELLFFLGLDEEIVGLTHFCIHPAEKARFKNRIGGTKNFQVESIKALKPDIIIGNKEENDQERILALEKDIPVWMSDIKTIDDAFDMIMKLGEIVDRRTQPSQLVHRIKVAISTLPKLEQPLTAVYLIWREPYLVAAQNTFIDSMLSCIGLENAAKPLSRYPEVSIDQLKAWSPDLLMLSSEPYPFKQKHIEELKLHLPKTFVRLVDGELFSWYGNRLEMAFPYFQQLLTSIAECKAQFRG